MKKTFRNLAIGIILGVLLFVFYKANHEVPILMYHRVDYPQTQDSVFVTPPTFERQMEFLKVHRYNVISLSELVELIRQKKRIPPKTVAITFDDGFLDNIKKAYPVLKKMEFPATVFMITANIGGEEWLSEEDLRILDESGITIGAHTVNHAYLPLLLTRTEVQAEITESKRRLENILGHPVTLFSYPAGGFTPEIRDIVRQAGYEGAVTTNQYKEKHNPYSLHRVKISESNGSLFSFWIKTTGLYHIGKKRPVAKAVSEE